MFRSIKNIYSIVVFVLAFTACAQEKSRNTNLKSADHSEYNLDSLKSVLNSYVDSKQLAGIQTAILHNKELIHYNSYGYADIESKKPLDEESIFRIFSMTKPITSVGLMQLYEQGKFKLEDPLHLYIPEFKNMTVFNENNEILPAKNAIKVIDLLRHSSGISYGRSPNSDLNNLYSEANLGNSLSLKNFIDKISKLPLLFEPATAYEYGHSTEICGYLIEVLSRQPVEDYLQEHILNPLKMKDTHFQLPKEKIKHFTTGYRASENGKLEVAELPDESGFLNKPNFIRAGGGLVSTTNDYINFCKMLLNKGSIFGHQFLKPETIDLMTRDHLASVREHTPRLRILPNETGFGLGFSIAEQDDGSIIYGWGGAVGTYFRIEPKKELAYIMMIQLSPYRQLRLRETFQSLVNDAIN
ncbi:serine hydrolase domain-containing protein [Winogradskyella sp. PE311]|uniref:serine hydrolase domain-containing protein n=1 Tax=Winogradskyella sp. PE311 TaxID=3366943 RepID=UPI00397F5794